MWLSSPTHSAEHICNTHWKTRVNLLQTRARFIGNGGDAGKSGYMCRCVTQVNGIRKGGSRGGRSSGPGHPAKREGARKEDRPKTRQYRLKRSRETGVAAGELGYENDPPIMRINNYICSWPRAFPNQINHHRSLQPKSFPTLTFSFISPTSNSLVLSHSLANCAIWGAGFKRHLLSNAEAGGVEKGRPSVYNGHAGACTKR